MAVRNSPPAGHAAQKVGLNLQKLTSLFFCASIPSSFAYAVERGIVLLTVLNVVLVIWDTEFPEGHSSAHYDAFYSVYITVEYVTTAVFSVEYLLRLWACVEDLRPEQQHFLLGRLRWMRKPMALVDLASIMPFLFVDVNNGFKTMRLLRVVSLLRIERLTKAFARLKVVFTLKSQELFITAYVTIVIFVLSSCVMYVCPCSFATPSCGIRIDISVRYIGI